MRPLLWVMNEAANVLVRLVGVTPVETVASTHGPAELQLLLAQSHQHGVLPDEEHQLLTGALRLEEKPVSAVMVGLEDAVTIPVDATVADVEAGCRDSGHSRLFVVDGQGSIVGLVHVRDAVCATSSGDPARPLREILQELSTLPGTLRLIDAVGAMRERQAQLAVVTGADGRASGLVALEDMLEQILGEFFDETDVPDPTVREV